MSFGFSPGDIVLFMQFFAKVISSLKDEGGSKAEFQLAERQCQAFLSVNERNPKSRPFESSGFFSK
jgi:hypothetical protein